MAPIDTLLFQLAPLPTCTSLSECRRGPDGKDSFGVGWIPELQQRTFPFIMAPINTRVVRRSAALLEGSRDGYGEQLFACVILKLRTGSAALMANRKTCVVRRLAALLDTGGQCGAFLSKLLCRAGVRA